MALHYQYIAFFVFRAQYAFTAHFNNRFFLSPPPPLFSFWKLAVLPYFLRFSCVVGGATMHWRYAWIEEVTKKKKL